MHLRTLSRLTTRACAFLLLAACSAATDAGTGARQGRGDAGAGGDEGDVLLPDGSTSDTSAGPDSGPLQLDGSSGYDAGTALSDGEACVGTKSDAQPTPLDIMVMFDQSSSMKGPRWDAVVGALQAFTNAPEAAGIRIALNYFALSAPCRTNGDCKSSWGKCGSTGFCTFDDYCDASAYENPEIEFAELPGAAAAIAKSLAAHAPLFNTPTPPALQGAINHARAWGTAHPDEKVVVLLATDGEPDSITCGFGNKDVPQVVQVAKSGLNGSPSIPTYVIGVGNKVGDVDAVAAAGGTAKAYMVDGSGGAATQKQFLDAMSAIRGSALPCAYAIPSPAVGTLDYRKVNVLYTPAGGGTAPVGMVDGASACSASGGWYYDDPAQPKSIVVCPATCDTFHASSGGSVEVQLGCETVIQVK